MTRKKYQTGKLKNDKVELHNVRLQVCSTFCTRLFPKLRKQEGLHWPLGEIIAGLKCRRKSHML